MGSGCSSPLRRFGKRAPASSSPRNSDPFGVNTPDHGQSDEKKSAIQTVHFTRKDEQPSTINIPVEQDIKYSDVIDDHPSTGSYLTDVKNNNDDSTKLSDQSSNKPDNLAPSTGDGSTTIPQSNNISNGPPAASGKATLFARMKGLNGSYIPHDRHLLVSPALSPAPSSTCYSPLPAISALNRLASLDINELVEAFEILTFGLSDDRIPILYKPQSELQQHYTQHLVQTGSDLINFISVIFISADSFIQVQEDGNNPQNNIDSNQVAKFIESNLKTFCDEHMFSLKFLNISQTYMKEHFRINNLVDVALRIVEEENQQTSQRIVIIILSNTTANISQDFDQKELPTKIEAQYMNKLLASKSVVDNEVVKNLLKHWYNHVGMDYHLKPIYVNNQAISSDSMDQRKQAWQDWLNDSTKIMKAIVDAITEIEDLGSHIKIKSHFESFIDYILKDGSLQKRTLLIRNQNQSPKTTPAATQANTVQTNLTDLARLLPDPNKLSVKRPVNDKYVKTISNWVQDNFSKFFETMIENQISHGKYIPPFIDRNLFQELTSQRMTLQCYLDKASDNFVSKCQNFYLSQILPIFNTVAAEANNNPTNTSFITNLEPCPGRGPPSSNHLVFISGPKGCGKTTLISQLIKFAAKDFHERAHILYRFSGISLDSLGCNRLLRSICEQFCQVQGENITAASYVYSNRKEIMNALNKIVRVQPAIIFLDGLEIFGPKMSKDLSWLCEFESTSNLKIVITLETDSKFYQEALSSYNDATYITLDNPTNNEWAQALNSALKQQQLNSGSITYDKIRRMSDSRPTSNPVTYHDMTQILNLTRIKKLNNESEHPELSIKDESDTLETQSIFSDILSHLEYLVSPYQLGSLIIALQSSRNGLYEPDLINILTIISQSSKVYSNTEYKFGLSLWYYIKMQMKPWLSIIICDKFFKLQIDREFANRTIAHYVSKRFPSLVEEVREILFDYFNRITSNGNVWKISSKNGITSADLDKMDTTKGNAKYMESLALATRFSELSNLMVLSNKSKASEHLVNKHQFFLQFLHGSMPEEFIEDCERLKEVVDGRKSSANDDLQSLVPYIKQSIYPLRYDGFQIYSQIYCRAFETIKSGKSTKSKKLNDIFSAASSPPVRSLLPVSEISVDSFIKTRIGHTLMANTGKTTTTTTTTIETTTTANGSMMPGTNVGPPGSSRNYQSGKQKIFTIKDDHRHVVVIHPDKSLLLVWDIYEEKAVRNINNIDNPRDLRMIDRKRAVILCNRELRVYDLDTGNMLTKLKGVMNQKMPFFEVFGESYVIALARNRMYVNMMNLNTGELETTFKVGEDRFLNSLLVSADGGICVCGDETQKPFPLLVWNLNERRLMYDLRLERHEFLTDISAISDDGHFVVSACRQLGESDNGSPSDNNSKKPTPNFIVIYDLSSGTLFKKWKPGLDTCAVAISYSPNRSGKVINTIADCTILVWDLVTGGRK